MITSTFNLLWQSLCNAFSTFLKHRDLLLIAIALFSLLQTTLQGSSMSMMLSQIQEINHHNFDSSELSDMETAKDLPNSIIGQIVSILGYIALMLIVGFLYRFKISHDIQSNFRQFLFFAKTKILPLTTLLFILWLGGSIGFMLFVLPGVYIVLITMLSDKSLLLGDTDVVESLKTSYYLMDGRKIGALLFYIATGLATFIILFVILTIVFMLLPNNWYFIASFIMIFTMHTIVILFQMMQFEFYQTIVKTPKF